MSMLFDSGYQIEVMEGTDRGRTIPVRGQEITLGRKLIPNERISNWILFGEPTVSRIHAVIEWDGKENTYVIAHKSKTNPTLVNSESVTRKALKPGDIVQMGLLIFKYTGKPAEMPAALPAVLAEAPTPDKKPEDEALRAASYVLEVLEGVDKGLFFPLQKEMILIGHKKNRDAGPDSILLEDDALPAEHLLLAWNAGERKYGIIRVESSVLPSRIRRGSEDMETSMEIHAHQHVMLEENDVISMGATLIQFRRVPPQKKHAVEGKAAGAKKRMSDATESRKHRSISLQLPRKAVPGGKEPDSSKPSKREGTAPPPDDPTFRLTEIDRLEPDFELHVLSGPDKGLTFSFLAADLLEEKLMTIGKRGVWSAAIELSDEQMENVQCGLIFRQGKMNIVNENPGIPLFVDSKLLEPGVVTELGDGVQVQIGHTLLSFRHLNAQGLQNRIMELQVLDGLGKDRNLSVALEKNLTRIGRAAECDLILTDPALRDIQAEIRKQNGFFLLEPGDPSALILVNGVSLASGRARKLHSGDTIRLSGRTLLLFTSRIQ